MVNTSLLIVEVYTSGLERRLANRVNRLTGKTQRCIYDVSVAT